MNERIHVSQTCYETEADSESWLIQYVNYIRSELVVKIKRRRLLLCRSKTVESIEASNNIIMYWIFIFVMQIQVVPALLLMS